MTTRYNAESLIVFARSLLGKVDLPAERAAAVADILVEGDLMGHTTHGLQLLAPYLKELSEGGMFAAGEPKVLQDRGSAVTWDGNYLPGPWLVTQLPSTTRQLCGFPLGRWSSFSLSMELSS